MPHLRPFWFILTGMFLLANASAQTLRLSLTDRVEDAQYRKLMMVTTVFGLKKDSVANPLDITTARGTENLLWYPVKVPPTPANLRTGYAWAFDGASDLKIAPNRTLLFIQNPGWTHYPTLIWVDRNHNMDVTDDGQPDTLWNGKSCTLHFTSSPGGYQMEVEHFPADKFPRFANMNDQEIFKIKGNRIFYGTASCFRERRLNVLAAGWKGWGDSFSIAVKDVNCNGIYNEPGIDMVILDAYHREFNNLNAVLLEKNGKTYLEWNNIAYTIRQIDAGGNWIEFLRDTASRLKYSLNVGQKIPRFKFCTATKPQKRRNIHRVKSEFIYLYVWRDGAEDYLRDSAVLHALGRTDSGLKVVALNYGASGRYVYRYNRNFNTALVQGFSSNHINEKLKIKRIPEGILLDRRKRIIAVGLTPQQVRRLISTNL